MREEYQSEHSDDRLQSLATVLRYAWKHACSDPRDKVFSVLSLARLGPVGRGNLAIPDYSMSVAAVYTLATMALLEDSPNALSFASRLCCCSKCGIKDLRCWVADFSSHECPLDYTLNRRAIVEVCDDCGSRQCSGSRTHFFLASGRYRNMSDSSRSATSDPPQIGLKNTSSRSRGLFRSHMTSIGFLGWSVDKIVEIGGENTFFRTLDKEGPKNRYAPHWARTAARLKTADDQIGGSRAEALFFTLLGGIWHNGFTLAGLAPAALQEIKDLWNDFVCFSLWETAHQHPQQWSAVEEALGDLDQLVDGSSTGGYCPTSDQVRNYPGDSKWFTFKNPSLCHANLALLLALRTALHRRRLFITAGNRLGLGPDSMMVGDEVWIIEGANVPYLLRTSLADSGRKGHLIDEAYVHGIMFGEAINDGCEARLEDIELD